MERKVRLHAANLPSVHTPDLQRLARVAWTDSEIARWFIGAVVEPPQMVTLTVKSFFAAYGVKEKKVPGWYFRHGSTVQQSLPHGESEVGDIAVYTDGRISYGRYGRSFEPANGERFNPNALKLMIKWTGLRPLGLPERPHHWDDPFVWEGTGAETHLATYAL